MKLKHDPYAIVAAKHFNVPLNEVQGEQRKAIKYGVFFLLGNFIRTLTAAEFDLPEDQVTPDQMGEVFVAFAEHCWIRDKPKAG